MRILVLTAFALGLAGALVVGAATATAQPAVLSGERPVKLVAVREQEDRP